MPEKTLKHMSRRELVELLAVMKKNEIKLKNRLQKVEAQLEEQTIRVVDATSVAETVRSVNQTFEALQAAANAYLQTMAKAKPAAQEDEMYYRR